MKKNIIPLLCVFCAPLLHAQISDISLNSIYFVKAVGGWDLYIKQPAGTGSIILTESQRDPEYKVTAYSLRAVAPQTVNSSEKRILNGKAIKSRDATIYLIDSTPEKIGTLGDFYHFFLTDEVVFGYPWARAGKMKIAAGVRINARLFAKKYGDYSGPFKDQWIVLTPGALPVEKAKAETTIVLLHSSDVDAEISPAPEPSPAPLPAPQPKTALVEAAEKISARALTRPAASSSYGSLVVETQARFPFEKIKDTQPAEDAELAAGDERVLTKFLFAVDQDKNTKSAGFATFHQDGQGRLVRVNEYGPDNLLAAVYVIEYGAGAVLPLVTAYDREGNALTAN